jgi:amidohydrolase
MVSSDQIKSLAGNYFEKIVSVRRHLHMHPELSFREFETSRYIQQHLTEAGIPFTSGHVKTGIIATIIGTIPSGKTVLIRGDMDALPIAEQNEIEYRSRNAGVMHACGHDAHSASVLGAALILNQLKDHWQGTVKIMFQPGEEVLPGGAGLMIGEGVLENPRVDSALALHVFPDFEAGTVGFREGMYMASTDELYLTVNGKGGHAAMTSEYVNPLIIASEMILAINRKFMDQSEPQVAANKIPTVVAFGKIIGNGATNIIPPKVEVEGTFRTMDEKWRSEVHEQLGQIVEVISRKHGIASELRIVKGYPFLVNDVDFTRHCIAEAGNYLGADKIKQLPLRMTAEDFAFISQEVPSCFFRLGIGNPQKGITSGVHTPTFDIDERALETGMGLLAWLAIRELAR